MSCSLRMRYTGLRLGELRALRWRDVVWADSLVHVRLNAPSSAPAGSAERRPKSQVVRSVPLADEAAKAIEGLSRREFHTSPNDYVFPSPTGSIIDGKRLRDALYRALESAGLDRCCSSKAGRAIRGVAIERCLGGSLTM